MCIRDSNGAALPSTARWGLREGSEPNPSEINIPSGNMLGNRSAGTYTVDFTNVEGFRTPEPAIIQIPIADNEAFVAIYEPNLSAIEEWRLENFGSSANTGDGADDQDFDHDGQSNFSEFIAGTIPTNSADHFEVNSILRSGSLVILQYDAKAGRSYELERLVTLSLIHI